jgi:hypothetical protein
VGLPTGMYIVRMTGENKVPATIHLVKE